MDTEAEAVAVVKQWCMFHRMRFRSGPQPDELLGDAWIVMYTQVLPAYNPEKGSLASFFRFIMDRRMHDRWRTENKRGKRAAFVYFENCGDEIVDKNVKTDEDNVRDMLAIARRAVNPRVFEIFSFACLHGLQAAASHYEIPLGTVKSLMTRVRIYARRSASQIPA